MLQTLKTITLTLLAAFWGLVASTGPSNANGFVSPSGNITCYWDTFGVENYRDTPLVCLIFEATWDTEPDCDADETRTLTLPPSGPATFEWVCHSDVFWPIDLGKLSYGSTWSMRAYECVVDTDGVHCTNQSGNGFHVRASTYRVF